MGVGGGGGGLFCFVVVVFCAMFGTEELGLSYEYEAEE